MLKITNGKETIVVSNAAFKTQFQPFGWRQVEQKQRVVKPEQVIADDKDIPPVVETVKVEKPLSEMSGKELKAKAKELGVDVSAATSKNEVRKMLADVIR